MVYKHIMLDILESIAPNRLAMDWDNTGLLIDAKEGYERLLICVDVSKDVLQEAIDENIDLIVSHHPLIFNGIKQIDESSVVFQAIKHGISVYAAHTNMDVVDGGLNDDLAKMIGLEQISHIIDDEGFASGRLGQVKEPMSLEAFANHAKAAVKAEGIRISGDLKQAISTVAVACGAGGGMLQKAKLLGADVLVTGEIKHNYYVDAINDGMAVVEAGHYATEKHFVNLMANRLQDAVNRLEYNLQVKRTEREKSPYYTKI